MTLIKGTVVEIIMDTSSHGLPNGTKVKITSDKLKTSIGEYYTTDSGMLVYRKDMKPLSGIAPKSYGDYMKQYEQVPEIKLSQPKCECGAKHTSFPSFHLVYCPLHKQGV